MRNVELEIDYVKDEQNKQEGGSHAQKVPMKKRFSLYNTSKNRNSGSGLGEKENTARTSSSKLMSLSPRNVFKQFTRNQGGEKGEQVVKEHKSMFTTNGRNKSKSTRALHSDLITEIEKEGTQAANLVLDQPTQDDHIVYINCSPEKNTSSRKEIENQYSVSKLVQTPYDSRKSHYTERTVHSASRDKFAQNINVAYNENNDSVQLDHQKKKPNLSSIIMVKQKSGLKTDRALQSEPILEKK